MASKRQLFELGTVVATPEVADFLSHSEVVALVARHVAGDWGQVPAEDAKENELSVKEGFRILSSYLVRSENVWIITEADRSVTTLLFDHQY